MDNKLNKIYPLTVFICVAVVVIVFEACLASGIPWGEYAFGGKFPGRLPDHMRGASVIQALVWCLWIIIALVRCDIILPKIFFIIQKTYVDGCRVELRGHHSEHNYAERD